MIGSRDYADESILLTAGKVSAYAITQVLIIFGDWDYTSFPSARYGEKGDLDSISAMTRARKMIGCDDELRAETSGEGKIYGG